MHKPLKCFVQSALFYMKCPNIHTFQLAAGLVRTMAVSTHAIVWMVLSATPPRETVRPVVMTETPTVTCGEEPGAGLAAKWVSVSNGYMWTEA